MIFKTKKKCIIALIFVVCITLSFSSSINALRMDIAKDKNILDKINERIIENNGNWVAGFTSVSNLSFVEKQFLLGAIDEKLHIDEDENLVSVDLPVSFDWRDVDGINYVTSVKNQLSCGSCVAFGVIATLESVLQISSGNIYSPDLSEASLFFCGEGSCNQGWIPSKAVDRLKFSGVPDESCFSYVPVDMPCDIGCSDWPKKVVKVSESHGVNTRDMKEALVTFGPLIVSFDVYEDFFYYKEGVYENLWGSRAGGHCVAIVGFDDGLGCWICKNSWGSNWGENGFFRIKYRKCNIDTGAIYIIVDSSNSPSVPSITSRVNIGKAGDSLSFTAESIDPENNGIYYLFDWGNGKNSGLLSANPSGEPLTVINSWSNKETDDFSVKVKAIDVYGYESDWSDIISITIENNPPNIPDKPLGNSRIKPDERYTYSSKVLETDGNQIFYLFDWGDGTNSGWLGPINSDEIFEASHIWDSSGSYFVRVKVSDVFGAESDWSEPLVISLGKTFVKYLILNYFFQKFLNFLKL